MVSRQLAPLLLGLGICFLASCCFLQFLLNRLDATSDLLLRQALFRDAHRGGIRHRRKDGHSYPMEGGYRIRQDSLRYQYDSTLDPSIIEPTVQDMRFVPEDLPTMDSSLQYDIRRCPDKVPDGYPVQWNIVTVLQNWNPDNTTIPSKIYQGICALDWKDPVQRDLAELYRRAEVPFLIHNHPEVWKTAERWSHYDYLHKLLGGPEATYRNEHAHSNHMPYWNLKGRARPPPGWTRPTNNVQLSFPDWYEKARQLEGEGEGDIHPSNITTAEHWYFRLNGLVEGQNEFLYDELPIFSPHTSSFFMPVPEAQRGINCRFGSRGIIAETHYDWSRNFILILHGQKRYVLAHPNQCQNLELHPQGHPSARHSKVDWSNPNEWNYGRFSQAEVNEVIMQAGDALYLPTAWFHFIVSLNLNFQCNARSGITYEHQRTITECGFG